MTTPVPAPDDAAKPKPAPVEPQQKGEAAAASNSVADTKTVAPSQKLSAEEQMERYEEHLKENDWGHQPC